MLGSQPCQSPRRQRVNEEPDSRLYGRKTYVGTAWESRTGSGGGAGGKAKAVPENEMACRVAVYRSSGVAKEDDEEGETGAVAKATKDEAASEDEEEDEEGGERVFVSLIPKVRLRSLSGSTMTWIQL